MKRSRFTDEQIAHALRQVEGGRGWRTPPVNVDCEFASYSSRTELVGGKLRYSRSFEIKQLSAPTSRAIELRNLY